MTELGWVANVMLFLPQQRTVLGGPNWEMFAEEGQKILDRNKNGLPQSLQLLVDSGMMSLASAIAINENGK